MGHTQNFTEIGHSSFHFVSFRFVSFWHLQTNGFFSTEVNYLCQRERDKQKREIERKIKWEKIQGRTVKWIEKDEKKNTKVKEIEMEKVRKARKQQKDGIERSVNAFFPFIGVKLTFQRCNNPTLWTSSVKPQPRKRSQENEQSKKFFIIFFKLKKNNVLPSIWFF